MIVVLIGDTRSSGAKLAKEIAKKSRTVLVPSSAFSHLGAEGAACAAAMAYENSLVQKDVIVDIPSQSAPHFISAYSTVAGKNAMPLSLVALPGASLDPSFGALEFPEVQDGTETSAAMSLIAATGLLATH